MRAASHLLLTWGARITGSVQTAQSNDAVLRERFNDQPRFKNHALRPPPPMLPSAVTVATNANGRPKFFRSRWNWSWKNPGSQKP